MHHTLIAVGFLAACHPAAAPLVPVVDIDVAHDPPPTRSDVAAPVRAPVTTLAIVGSARDPLPAVRREDALVAKAQLDLIAPWDPKRGDMLKIVADDEFAQSRVSLPPHRRVFHTLSALRAYERFIREFPNHPQIDEATYYEGLAWEHLGQPLPYVHFAFGEMWMKEGAIDPSRYSDAAREYQEALNLLSPNEPLAAKRQMAEAMLRKR
jgi:hypothetical protein